MDAYSFSSILAPIRASMNSLIPSVRLCIESEKHKLKNVAQLALKKMPFAEEEALSQSKYKRGVSARNFEVEDLKAQASLYSLITLHDFLKVEDDDDEVPRLGEKDESVPPFVNDKSSSFSIKKTTKSLPKVQIDDDLDLIDEDSLLTEEDLKKPQIPIGTQHLIENDDSLGESETSPQEERIDAPSSRSSVQDLMIKIKPPSSPAGRFTQILSVGIALGPLKVCLQVYEYLHGVMSAFDPELCCKVVDRETGLTCSAGVAPNRLLAKISGMVVLVDLNSFLKGQFSIRHFVWSPNSSRHINKGVVKPSCVLLLTEENVEKVLDEVRPSLMADGVVPYEAETTIANMVKMWVNTRDRNYKVKPGYKVAIDNLSTINTHRADGDWTQVWNLVLPSKVNFTCGVEMKGMVGWAWSGRGPNEGGGLRNLTPKLMHCLASHLQLFLVVGFSQWQSREDGKLWNWGGVLYEVNEPFLALKAAVDKVMVMKMVVVCDDCGGCGPP
ncbi:hypothetical protein Syun_018630 [Stephania yunnanensis]|uniref:Uncharacterized protein n=1 Tax=Stephania yunnanensis TaxID=152371 RepID=A0AAP0NW09_9MAGN